MASNEHEHSKGCTCFHKLAAPPAGDARAWLKSKYPKMQDWTLDGHYEVTTGDLAEEMEAYAASRLGEAEQEREKMREFITTQQEKVRYAQNLASEEGLKREAAEQRANELEKLNRNQVDSIGGYHKLMSAAKRAGIYCEWKGEEAVATNERAEAAEQRQRELERQRNLEWESRKHAQERATELESVLGEARQALEGQVAQINVLLLHYDTDLRRDVYSRMCEMKRDIGAVLARLPR